MQLIENETFKFEEQICDFEEELNNASVPDDIREDILAAVGKARLLMAQKLAQFRGLCDRNIVSWLFIFCFLSFLKYWSVKPLLFKRKLIKRISMKLNKYFRPERALRVQPIQCYFYAGISNE